MVDWCYEKKSIGRIKQHATSFIRKRQLKALQKMFKQVSARSAAHKVFQPSMEMIENVLLKR